MIELLVVISILALLLALLVPVLGRAKDIARFTLCRANLRTASTGFIGFTLDHKGRLPGMARSTVEYWTVCWPQILNREYYHKGDVSVYPTSAYGDEPTCGPLVKFWYFWSAQYYDNNRLTRTYLTCPSYVAWGGPPGYSNQWSRPWLMSSYAAGGGYMAPYPTGLEISPASSVHRNYAEYYLGARMEVFRDPSSKYLIWDSESGSDYTWGGDSGKVTVNSDPTFPPWTSINGRWSFRHLLPPGPKLYQAQARGNALYIDGHTGILSPNGRIDLQQWFDPAL